MPLGTVDTCDLNNTVVIVMTGKMLLEGVECSVEKMMRTRASEYHPHWKNLPVKWGERSGTHMK